MYDGMSISANAKADPMYNQWTYIIDGSADGYYFDNIPDEVLSNQIYFSDSNKWEQAFESSLCGELQFYLGYFGETDPDPTTVQLTLNYQSERELIVKILEQT